jgi:predicted nucleic acid-binding protein
MVEMLEKTRAGKIHDKIIILTAKLVNATALITKDEGLKELKEVKVVWS